MISKKLSLLEVLIAFVAIVLFTFLYEVSSVVSHDGLLYEGLADNLMNGTGYYDTIRNDFILPSIGHPIIIALFKFIGVSSGFVFGKLMFAIGLLLSVILVRVLELKRFLRLLIVPALYFAIPLSYHWGAEMSLFVSIMGLLTAIAWFWKKQSWLSTITVGIMILFHVLVRPIGLPFLYLALFVLLISFWKNRKSIKYILVAVVLPVLMVTAVGVVSNGLYQDNRLISGTYSDIPLYCANNGYLDLETNYYSSNWNSLPDEVREEAIAPLLIETNWQDRAELLKSKTVEFMKNEPGKAFHGFAWRLSKYTVNQKLWPGLLLFLCWLLGCIMFVLRFKFSLLKKHWGLSLLTVILPIYVVCLTSLFPYVGFRYNLSPNIYFIIAILFMISLYSSLTSAKR